MINREAKDLNKNDLYPVTGTLEYQKLELSHQIYSLGYGLAELMPLPYKIKEDMLSGITLKIFQIIAKKEALKKISI